MKHQPIPNGPPTSSCQKYSSVAVIGAGSWGTALAATLARAGVSTRLWGRNLQVINEINRYHRHSAMLPDVDLPTSLYGLHEMEHALKSAALP